MRVTAEKSVMSAISRVRSNDCNRSAQNLRRHREKICQNEKNTDKCIIFKLRPLLIFTYIRRWGCWFALWNKSTVEYWWFWKKAGWTEEPRAVCKQCWHKRKYSDNMMELDVCRQWSSKQEHVIEGWIEVHRNDTAGETEWVHLRVALLSSFFVWKLY